MKIVSIVGTRPNLVKEYAVHRQLQRWGIEEVLVHTGQHYDYEMSDLFFEELSLPRPHYINTLVKGSHAQETATIMVFVEDVLLAEQPDATLVYGDVNSTLAAAVASAKLRVPVAHVEAGIRSQAHYNPEEVNRRVADVLAEVLFPATQSAYDHLIAEGYDPKVTHLVGDTILDALQQAMREHHIAVTQGDYLVATVHRAENADDPARLANIVEALCRAPQPVRFPVHPRTGKSLRQFGLWDRLERQSHVELLPSLGFLSFLRLLAGCDRVVTDSGGVRREGYMLGKPVVTLIDLIWFPELIASGWNQVADPGSAEGILEVLRSHRPQGERPPVFGDGRAAERIARILAERYQ